MVLLRENWCWSLLENGQLVLHHCCKTSLQKRRYFFAFFRWPKASEKRARSARHETCATGEGTLRSSEINTWSAGYCKMGWRAMLRVLPPTTRPCLAAIKVVVGCGKLLEKLESSSTLSFATKSVHVVRFTDPRQTCFAASDETPVYGVTAT